MRAQLYHRASDPGEAPLVHESIQRSYTLPQYPGAVPGKTLLQFAEELCGRGIEPDVNYLRVVDLL